MNKGVEILLERMDSSPDEFVAEMPYGSVNSKWIDILRGVHARVNGVKGDAPYYDLKFLSDDDIKALHTKLQEIRGDEFTRHVMAKLLTDDSSQEANSQFVGGSPFNTQAYKSSIKIGRHELNDEKMDLLESIMKEQDLKMRAELQRKYLAGVGQGISCK